MLQDVAMTIPVQNHFFDLKADNIYDHRFKFRNEVQLTVMEYGEC